MVQRNVDAAVATAGGIFVINLHITGSGRELISLSNFIASPSAKETLFSLRLISTAFLFVISGI